MQPSIGSNYQQLYKWIYSTGISHTLQAPPIITDNILMFIKPEPTYTLGEMVTVNIAGIGGVTDYYIFPDIALYKDKDSDTWSIYIIPRNASTE